MSLRPDAVGLWWQDYPVEKTGRAAPVARTPPPVPDTGWLPPKDFPNLSGSKVLAIDTETKDPGLLDYGPGFVRGDAHVVGVAVGTEDGGRWYFPFAHEYEPERNLNLDRDNVLAWCRDTFAVERTYVGANILYDLEALHYEGVDVVGRFLDVQFAEPLLVEDRRTSLDAIAQKHLGEHKVDDELYRWLQRAYGGPEGRRQAANIWRAPITLTGPYAEGDVDLPLRALVEQRKKLAAEGLTEVFELECRLIPLLLAMRLRGVPVDVERARFVSDTLRAKEEAAQAVLDGVAGRSINVDANTDLEVAYTKAGIAYPTTEAGNSSFAAPWLKTQADPLSAAVLDVRKYSKARNPFVDSYILERHVSGRVHCRFHPLRGDEYGAVSGRFSSSDPNLQNIPARDEEIAGLVRSVFVPEPGHRWRRYDWSQIEFRFLVHFAVGEGAGVARGMYLNDPDTDFHEFAQALVLKLTGVDLGRKPTKNINFGLVYGMGITKLAAQLMREVGEVKELFGHYHTALPFVKETFDLAAKRAERRGFVKTLLGRRARFDTWEPRRYGDNRPALPYEQAVAEYGAVRRAMTHKALNRVLQGSAADAMKLAMVQMWEAGLFAPSVLGAPLLTVHDELDFSDPCTPEGDQAFREVEHILSTCVDLKVPIVADLEVGPNWGELRGRD